MPAARLAPRSFDHQMRGPFFVLCAAFLFAGANAVAKALYMRGHTLVRLLLVGHTLVGQAPFESATRPSSCVVAS